MSPRWLRALGITAAAAASALLVARAVLRQTRPVSRVQEVSGPPVEEPIPAWDRVASPQEDTVPRAVDEVTATPFLPAGLVAETPAETALAEPQEETLGWPTADWTPLRESLRGQEAPVEEVGRGVEQQAPAAAPSEEAAPEDWQAPHEEAGGEPAARALEGVSAGEEPEVPEGMAAPARVEPDEGLLPEAVPDQAAEAERAPSPWEWIGPPAPSQEIEQAEAAAPPEVVQSAPPADEEVRGTQDSDEAPGRGEALMEVRLGEAMAVSAEEGSQAAESLAVEDVVPSSVASPAVQSPEQAGGETVLGAKEAAILHAYTVTDERAAEGEHTVVLAIGEVQVPQIEAGRAHVMVPLEISHRGHEHIPRTERVALEVVVERTARGWRAVEHRWARPVRFS